MVIDWASLALASSVIHLEENDLVFAIHHLSVLVTCREDLTDSVWEAVRMDLTELFVLRFHVNDLASTCHAI